MSQELQSFLWGHPASWVGFVIAAIRHLRFRKRSIKNLIELMRTYKKHLSKMRGEFPAPRAGFEPATYRLTADRSTIELPGIDSCGKIIN